MRTTRKLSLGLIVLALTGCGSERGGSTTISPAAPTTMTPTTMTPATASPTVPAMHEWGGATFVTGTITDFVIDEGIVTTDADGTAHSRDGSLTDTFVSDDPRVSGRVTATWNSDRWGTSPTDGALVQWGTATLTNDGGTWEGAWAGTMASPVGDMICRWWRGTGGYAGLTFYMWLQAENILDPGTTWYGLVYEGTPPDGF